MTNTLTSGQPIGSAKAAVPLIPDATNLSWLAETADGSRGETLYLVKDNKDRLQLVPQQGLNGRTELAIITTPKTRPGRKQVTHVVCKAENYEATLSSIEKFDAVFWTESSVEKFLYPYYRAHRIWDANMDEVKRRFDEYDTAVAIAHRAPSTSETLSAAQTLHVGVVENKALTWMTLKDFLAYQPA